MTHVIDVLQACKGIMLSSGHRLSSSIGHSMGHPRSSILVGICAFRLLSSRLLTAAATNRLLTGSLLMGSARPLMGSARLLTGNLAWLVASCSMLVQGNLLLCFQGLAGSAMLLSTCLLSMQGALLDCT